MERLLLLVRENLLQLGVRFLPHLFAPVLHFLLKLRHLLLLVGAQVQPLLEEVGEDLTERRGPARPASRTAGRWARRTTGRTARPSLLLGTSRPRARTARTTAPTASTAPPTDPFAHLMERLLLLVRQDLVEPAVHVLLEFGDLLLLVLGQMELVLEEPGQDLAGPWGTARTAGPAPTGTAPIASGFVLGAGEAGDQHQHAQHAQDTNQFPHRHTSLKLAGKSGCRSPAPPAPTGLPGHVTHGRS